MGEKHPEQFRSIIEAVESEEREKRKFQRWYTFFWFGIPLARGVVRFVFRCVFILLVVGVFYACSWLGIWLFKVINAD